MRTIIIIAIAFNTVLHGALVTRYVNTASTAGGDGTTNATSGANRAYVSLFDAEAAEQTDLVAAGNSMEIICEGSTADSTAVSISGWTTGASNRLTVKATTGKHTGTPGTGYRITSSDVSGTLRIGEEYVTIDGLEIINTAAGTAALAFPSGLGSSNDIIVANSLIWNSATSSSSYTIVATQTNLRLTFYNNAVWGGSRTWDTRGATAVTATFCTFWRHADQLGLVSGSELALKNSYSGKASGSSEDYWSGGSPTGNNNASSDTTATARFTSSINSLTGSNQFTSVTSGSENFALKAGNGLAAQAATGTGITTDILGVTRDSPPDIGAFESVGGGGGGGIGARRRMVIAQ